jgi:hypothetical protein
MEIGVYEMGVGAALPQPAPVPVPIGFKLEYANPMPLGKLEFARRHDQLQEFGDAVG